MATRKKISAPDPTTDEALRALDPAYAAPPDMPVGIAIAEHASLARRARACQAKLTKVGVTAAMVDTLSAYARRLGALEKAWHAARARVRLSPADKKLRAEAEALDAKLLAGGRWACRRDAQAQAELSRIAEGAGLADTVQDLQDLVAFWAEREDALSTTDITRKDLARAATLADALGFAVANEGSDVEAGAALELRNRAFWAADALAKEVREGGRYALRLEPKLASKFVSRYRAAVAKRAKRKQAGKVPASA